MIIDASFFPLNKKLMYFFAFLTFYFTPFLAQNCFLVADFEQKFGELTITLYLLRQSVVLILQTVVLHVKLNRFCQGLRSYIQ